MDILNKPVREVIQPLRIDLGPYIQKATGFSGTASGQNSSTEVQNQSIAFDKPQAETVGVEVSSPVPTGTELVVEYSLTGLPSSWSMSLTLSFR